MRRRTLIMAAALAGLGGPVRATGVMTDWKGPPAAPPI